MAADLNYLINFTDDSLKAPITLSPKTRNDSSLSITLYGYGSAGWGERLQENIIRVMENFASPNQPQNPTIGQLWFDSSATIIKAWTGTAWQAVGVFTNASAPTNPRPGDIWYDSSLKVIKYWNGTIWAPVGAYSGTTAPTSPYLGMLWYNSSNKKMYYWDATVWRKIETDLDATLDAKVNVSGDTLTGFLTLHADPTSSLHAVTKQYADSKFVDVAGDTMTGYLTLNADPASAKHAATKQYVDNNYVNLAGSAMNGYLTLYADPTAAKHAATKQYVDSATAALSNTIGTKYTQINPTTAKDGDIKTTGTAIYIYMTGVWRQVWPATYS